MVNNPTNIKQKDYFVDENTGHGMGKAHKKIAGLNWNPNLHLLLA